MKKPTEWKYYVLDDGECADDATVIHATNGFVWNASDAATIASEDIWDNRDGWECGIDLSDVIVIIDPDGEETKWRTSYEMSVDYYATEVTE